MRSTASSMRPTSARRWCLIPRLIWSGPEFRIFTIITMCFQYATGFSAAIALARRIRREGEAAVRDYLGFLSGGCSKDPIDLLKGAGVDMTTAAPVQEALDLFAELLDEMEQLTEEK